MHEPIKAVVVGGSAGALDALSTILEPLPADFDLPILVTVHVPANKQSLLAELFRRKCRLAVHEAEDKMPIAGGTIYFAPPDYHLLIEPDRQIALSVDEPVNFSRPSIDVLFESAADAYFSSTMGIILSGANADGALGLKRICEQGGIGLVQQPESAYASAMPAAALAICPNATSLSLLDISQSLLALGIRR